MIALLEYKPYRQGDFPGLVFREWQVGRDFCNYIFKVHLYSSYEMDSHKEILQTVMSLENSQILLTKYLYSKTSYKQWAIIDNAIYMRYCIYPNRSPGAYFL